MPEVQAVARFQVKRGGVFAVIAVLVNVAGNLCCVPAQDFSGYYGRGFPPSVAWGFGPSKELNLSFHGILVFLVWLAVIGTP